LRLLQVREQERELSAQRVRAHQRKTALKNAEEERRNAVSAVRHDSERERQTER